MAVILSLSCVHKAHRWMPCFCSRLCRSFS